MIDRIGNEVVFVLIESNDDGYSVLGIYRDSADALREKYAIIRECFDISEDEVADQDLDADIETTGSYYEIVKRNLL